MLEDGYADAESGPFCAHWGDFTCECWCGHFCGDHDEQKGSCAACECAKFEEFGATLKQRAKKAFTS